VVLLCEATAFSPSTTEIYPEDPAAPWTFHTSNTHILEYILCAFLIPTNYTLMPLWSAVESGYFHKGT
ncbi:uncharacterized protein METZ01_LOCUS72588, partial [marine metagenome]